MIKKILTYILLFSLLHLVSCYSKPIVYPIDSQWLKEESRKADEITIYLMSGDKYKFATGYYHIKNDTITGEGFAITNEIEEPYQGSIPLSQIKSIHFDEWDTGKKLLLLGLGIGVLFAIYMITDWEKWNAGNSNN